MGIFRFAAQAKLPLNPGQIRIASAWEGSQPPPVLAVSVGRRLGSSTLGALLLAHEAAQFLQSWDPLPGSLERPAFLYQSVTSSESSGALGLARRFLAISHPELRVDTSKRDQLTLRQGDREVRIYARGDSQMATRGLDVRVAVLDVASHFRDLGASLADLGVGILGAQRPCRVLLLSDPGKDPGNPFNQIYWDLDSRGAALRVPTWESGNTTEEELWEHGQCWRDWEQFRLEIRAEVPRAVAGAPRAMRQARMRQPSPWRPAREMCCRCRRRALARTSWE